MTPEQRQAMETWNRDVQTLDAQARAAESRASVLAARASDPNVGDRYTEFADEAQTQADDFRAKYAELVENPPDLWDPEGTKPTMADSFGNYARTSHVANAGGIGVKGSNSTESGEPADDPEDAGVFDESMAPVIMDRGGRPTTLAGQRLIVHPDDEHMTADAEEDAEEGTASSGRRSTRRTGRKARASSRRRTATSDEE